MLGLGSMIDFGIPRRRFAVHTEITIIIALVKGEFKDVLPYIGVSKLSCMTFHLVCVRQSCDIEYELDVQPKRRRMMYSRFVVSA